MAPSVWFDKVCNRIASIYTYSPPEMALHSTNVLQWVKELFSSPSENLIIAAMSTDLDDDEFLAGEFKNSCDLMTVLVEKKAKSQKRSAEKIGQIMRECEAPEADITEVVDMVSRLAFFELDEQSVILRQADALSFFDVLLPFYKKRHFEVVVRERCRWEFGRLTELSRGFLNGFYYVDPRSRMFLTSLIKEATEL